MGSFRGYWGCGVSALAMLALKQGYEVSGSDIAWSNYMDGLQEAGARLHVGHSVSCVQRNNRSGFPDAIFVSSAIPQDNVEILHAKSVGVPVYKRDYWLEGLTENYNLIAVSGTHGKSTTASMLAYVLKEMRDDIKAVVGAHVPQFHGGNIIWGGDQNFVLEADEYDGCFLRLSPYIAVVTNLDWEHVIATVIVLIGNQRQLSESIDRVKLHLNNFVGISRRFEWIGTICGCHMYDEYAHHPTEVHAVLQAARQRFPFKRCLVIFQPHTYSRLAALKDDFAAALSDTDQVVVTAVYAARETNIWNVSGKDLAASIAGPVSEYIPSLGDVIDKLVVQICQRSSA